jgi:hypothetical protein
MNDQGESDRIDRTAFSVVTSHDDEEERAYWRSRTPDERIRHMETLRRINYGAAAEGRLRRVLEVVIAPWCRDRSEG